MLICLFKSACVNWMHIIKVNTCYISTVVFYFLKLLETVEKLLYTRFH